MEKLSFWLKTSRPGLWFPTIWLYLLPLGREEFWTSPWFWAGLVYVSFPLNFLIYGWNDFVDHETDRLNPRKGNFLFGAKGTKKELKSLPIAIFLVQLLCFPVFFFVFGWKSAVLFIAWLAILAAYNFPGRGLRNTPVLDLLAQLGYLLVVPFSILINSTQGIPTITFFYLFLFAIQSQLMGEVMDIAPDRASGRQTTATVLGRTKTKILLILIVLIETILVLFVYRDYIFGAMFFGALAWLILDLTVLWKNKEYTLPQMKLFGWGSNAIALASMVYVWWSGCLLIVPS